MKDMMDVQTELDYNVNRCIRSRGPRTTHSSQRLTRSQGTSLERRSEGSAYRYSVSEGRSINRLHALDGDVRVVSAEESRLALRQKDYGPATSRRLCQATRCSGGSWHMMHDA